MPGIQNQSSEYTYFAFVSYNWRDARWAQWLQRSLEHYRLPSVARKEVGHEARIRPVFRFETDLGAADLRRDLHKELEQSRYLIVVCSPNSAFPNVKGEHWVNDEIARFVEMGRTDRIVPVIVGGNPDSDGPDRCFPPALAQAKISGISVRKEGRGQALQKIVAKLLGLRPDILIDRWHRDLHKKRLLSAFCVLPAVLLAALVGLFAWDASRDVTADYADYTESYGLPRGIFRLSPGEIPGRNCLYRFHWQGFRHGNSPHLPSENEPSSLFAPLGFRRILRRIEQTGPVGHPKRLEHTEFSGRSPVMEFSYDGNRLAEIRHGEFVGIGLPPRLVKRELFSDEPGDPFPNGLVEFKGEKNSTFLGQLAHATSMKGNPSDFHVDIEDSGRSRIAKHRILRDRQGRPAHVSFLDAEGMPLSDADGIWGFDFLYDDWGRVAEWWYCGQDGRRAGNRTGVAGRLYRYENRHLQFVYYVDRNRQPHPSHQGWAVCRIWADALDRAAKTRYYDAENEPALSLETGVAGFDMAYDPQGLRTNVLYVGLDGKPTLNRKDLFPTLLAGNGDNDTDIAGFRSQFDAMGNETNRAFFGLDGAPTLSADGIAGCACEFDARGNMTRQLNFGLDGLPAPNREDGVAGYSLAYDARGFLTNAVCLGTNGLPSLSKQKFSGLRLGFDDQRNLTFCLAFDVDGSPCTFDGTDVAGFRIARDSFGNPTNLMRFGVDGQPCLDADGIAGFQSEFDARGRETRRTFLGTNGTPVLFKGVAGYNSEVQEHGRLAKIAYFGLQDEKTLSDDGIAGHVAELDGEGRETTRRFFALDGTPATRCDGVSWWTNTYGNGVLVQRDSFAPDGRGGILDNPRIHHSLTRFDKDEHVIEERYFDANGNPVADAMGIARTENEYANGVLVRKVFSSPPGQGGCLGSANAQRAVVRLDSDQRPVGTELYDPDGHLLHPVCGPIGADSAAARAGVQTGDVVLRYGRYRLDDPESVAAFPTEVQALKAKKRTLLVARRSEDRWNPLSFVFPKGEMGILMEYTFIGQEDMDALQPLANQADMEDCDK